MKKYLLLITLVLSVSSSAFALDVPAKPDNYVTDKAEVISPSVEAELNTWLKDFETKTSTQLVVATFTTLDGDVLEDFSIKLAEKWKIGQKGSSNGVILLVISQDRKLRIEVGYGLEGALPDALSLKIINSVIVPRFKAGDFSGGIKNGLEAIAAAVGGEEFAEKDNSTIANTASSPKTGNSLSAALWSLGKKLIVIFFILDLFRYLKYNSSHKETKGKYKFWGWWGRFAITLMVLQFLFRIIFRLSLSTGRGSAGSYRGFSGGGSFSGGSSSSFSGGGGSFGGGGSSGSW